MVISELQEYINQYSKDKGFDKSTIEQRTLFLVTEVGELVRELLHISYHPEREDINEIKQKIGLEMFDVVWNIMELANKLGIDVKNAFEEKIEINKDRIWK